MRNTYYILCLIFAVLFFEAVPHASAGQSILKLGIRGGANFANFDNTGSDFSTRTGFMAGPYLTLLLPNNPLSIQPEVLYTQKGAKFRGIDSGTIGIDYIEIPVLAKVDLFRGGPAIPHLYAGPYIGFKVYSQKPSQPIDISVNKDFYPSKPNPTDFGITLGAGVDISAFNMGLRYDGGLTKVIDENKARNNVFSIVAGIDL